MSDNEFVKRQSSGETGPSARPAPEAEPSAAFTPGPLVFGDSSMDDPSPGPKWEVYTPDKGGTAYCFRRADAQLYAAAPDLLAALRGAEVWLTAALECPTWSWDADQHEAATECRDAARVAIAKARGASPASPAERPAMPGETDQ